MADPGVIHQMQPQRPALPDVIEIDPTEGMPPHSARETSLLAQLSGKKLEELVGDNADQGDRERVLVWFRLRRLGYEPTWDEAGDVLINYVLPNPPSGGASTGSPPSATTGG